MFAFISVIADAYFAYVWWIFNIQVDCELVNSEPQLLAYSALNLWITQFEELNIFQRQNFSHNSWSNEFSSTRLR